MIAQRQIKLQFYGYFSAENSMSNICCQFALELSKYIPKIALSDCSLYNESWKSYSKYEGSRQPLEGNGIKDPQLKVFNGCDSKAPIGFFYGTPEEAWPKLKHHTYKIGGFVCETNRIPQTWVDVCNRLNLIIVPSHFCYQVFRESGVYTPVKVVPHGLEEEFRPYSEKKQSDPFVFFNTFSAYSFPERKSCEELIRCFLKAFQGRRDVVLRLRTHRFGPIIDYERKYHFGNQIQIMPLQFEKLVNVAYLFDEAHCTVHPSKGEGFGLIPFQSIACETPVIAPCASGMAEYVSSKTAMPLNMRALVKGPSWDNQPGSYYAVDEDHLIYLLRYASENWSYEYKKVQKVGHEFRNKYCWRNVLQPVIKDVLDTLKIYAATPDLERFYESYDNGAIQ